MTKQFISSPVTLEIPLATHRHTQTHTQTVDYLAIALDVAKGTWLTVAIATCTLPAQHRTLPVRITRTLLSDGGIQKERGVGAEMGGGREGGGWHFLQTEINKRT